MSKGGGAGKVYFVLYLAVVLELLIIIVDRDEAEDGLLRKQKESMRIVESILSQLQSGAGTEGINTRPQDEITIPPTGVNIKEIFGTDLKSSRKYIVEVGVTDISTALKKQEGEPDKDYQIRVKKLIKLANVEEIEYQIFYSTSPDPNNAPMFPSSDTLERKGINFAKFQQGQTINGPDGSEWKMLGLRRLTLDEAATYNGIDISNMKPEAIHPVYPMEKRIQIGDKCSPPNMPDDSVFYYSERENGNNNSSALKKKSFAVNFQPPNQAGWYKLRFSSRTNRILGVRKDAPVTSMESIPDETTVNIGTVQLTVRDLKKVYKELTSKLEKYQLPLIDVLIKENDIEKFDRMLENSKRLAVKDPDVVQTVGKIDLYGYISKLLAPGQSIHFSQNLGAIEFNVHVLTPKPQIAQPVVDMPTYIACFDKLKPVFQISISPFRSENDNKVVGHIKDINGAVVANISFKAQGGVVASSKPEAGNGGGSRAYLATVDQALSAGKYTVEIMHTISGKSSSNEPSELVIFPTKLTSDNESLIKDKLNYYTVYGNKFFINAIPASGGKIPADQFRIYLNTDIDQKPPIEGLDATDSKALVLTPDASKVNLKVTWKQPYTGEEVDLLPQQSSNIKQEVPSINDQFKIVSASGQEQKVKIKISPITVKGGSTGSDKQVDANTQVWLSGKADVKVDGYEISQDPVIEKDGDKYTITLEISGRMPRGNDKITGTINIPISAKSINPINKKESENKVKNVQARLDYEPESSRRTTPQSRPSGGSTPSSKPIKKK